MVSNKMCFLFMPAQDPYDMGTWLTSNKRKEEEQDVCAASSCGLRQNEGCDQQSLMSQVSGRDDWAEGPLPLLLPANYLSQERAFAGKSFIVCSCCRNERSFVQQFLLWLTAESSSPAPFTAFRAARRVMIACWTLQLLSSSANREPGSVILATNRPMHRPTFVSASCSAFCCLMALLFVLVLWLDFAFIWNQSIEQPDCLIKSSTGWIKGHRVEVQGKRVCEYLGIPYAASPTGRRRFAKPEPRKGWKKTLHASSFGASCPQQFPAWARWMMRQKVLNYSEDCLFLNVWAPSGSCAGKPVLFWLHGGGFQFGAGSLLETNGSVLSALHDVVVVTINFRLNAFGFLSLGHQAVPGNMGLYDQVVALHWVRKNAGAFGAAANSVTIWGQGMGSISVSAHLVSPMSRGLFHRAIMQTGSIMTAPEMYSRSADVADEFLEASGCQYAEDDEGESESGNEEQVIDCLRKASMQRLMQATANVSLKNPVPFLFTPDEEFFNYSTPNSIKHTLSTALSPDLKNLLIGFNSDEGSLLLNSLSPESFPESGEPVISALEQAKRFLLHLFTSRLGVAKSIIQTGINNEFAVNRTSKEQIVKAMIDFVGNNIFVCPTIIFGEEVALSEAKASVHMFSISSRSGYNHLPQWFGTIHNEEVPMMFGMPLTVPDEFSAQDTLFSRKLMQTISNFARSGSASFDSETWPPFSSSQPFYMDMNKHQSRLRRGIHEKSCSLFKLALDLAD